MFKHAHDFEKIKILRRPWVLWGLFLAAIFVFEVVVAFLVLRECWRFPDAGGMFLDGGIFRLLGFGVYSFGLFEERINKRPGFMPWFFVFQGVRELSFKLS